MSNLNIDERSIDRSIGGIVDIDVCIHLIILSTRIQISMEEVIFPFMGTLTEADIEADIED